MYVKEQDRIGIVVDMVSAVMIYALILLSISWLLEITGNSFYTILVMGYAAMILMGALAFIEIFWGPISTKYIYQNQILATKKKIEALQKDLSQYKIYEYMQEHNN